MREIESGVVVVVGGMGDGGAHRCEGLTDRRGIRAASDKSSGPSRMDDRDGGGGGGVELKQ